MPSEHALPVATTRLTADLRARQLSVVDVNLVPRHGRLHQHERVGGHLVPQPSASAVDHDAHLGRGVNKQQEYESRSTTNAR